MSASLSWSRSFGQWCTMQHMARDSLLSGETRWHEQVGEFMESPFVGAGFQLSSADVLLEVPFDPKLDMLFVGEEILYSARLWTKGWDMYAPDMNLVWHHYNR